MDHRIDEGRSSYQDVYEGGDEDYDDVEHGRPWLPHRLPDCRENRRQDKEGAVASSNEPEEAAQPFEVPEKICKEITTLLTEGISTEKSKKGSNLHPLAFEEEGFSLKPPKLDNWAIRRAKDKGVAKVVTSAEETMIKIQLKIMDIGQPIIAFYSRLQALLEADDPQSDCPTTMEDLVRGL